MDGLKPKARIFADSAKSEPTKPSKYGSVRFEGAILAQSYNIEVVVTGFAMDRLKAALNRLYPGALSSKARWWSAEGLRSKKPNAIGKNLLEGATND
ncbi:MAG: hypothetical protein ABSG13_30540 [Bryobacteraceae bacterium]|jgi:hypothetical protein